jgi:hypothetical protein
MRQLCLLTATELIACEARGQSTNNPFPAPIPASDGVITVKYAEFAIIPDNSGEAPRMMRLLDEPGTRRLFVNTMRGPLYSAWPILAEPAR